MPGDNNDEYLDFWALQNVSSNDLMVELRGRVGQTSPSFVKLSSLIGDYSFQADRRYLVQVNITNFDSGYIVGIQGTNTIAPFIATQYGYFKYLGGGEEKITFFAKQNIAALSIWGETLDGNYSQRMNFTVNQGDIYNQVYDVGSNPIVDLGGAVTGVCIINNSGEYLLGPDGAEGINFFPVPIVYYVGHMNPLTVNYLDGTSDSLSKYITDNMESVWNSNNAITLILDPTKFIDNITTYGNLASTSFPTVPNLVEKIPSFNSNITVLTD